MADKITLSSRLTFVTKVVIPTLWIGGFGIVTVVFWTSSGTPPQMKWTFLAFLIVGSLSFWWFSMPLKRVRVDGNILYVSNYLKQVEVPLEFVERVTENRWINIRPVTLYLRRVTDFGNKIAFMPKTKFLWFWASHPVVGQIRRMVEEATAVGDV